MNDNYDYRKTGAFGADDVFDDFEDEKLDRVLDEIAEIKQTIQGLPDAYDDFGSGYDEVTKLRDEVRFSKTTQRLQDEIKRFLVQLGSHKRWRFFFNFFLKHKDTGEKPYIMPIVHACMNMSKTKTGALIVIEQGVSLDNYKNTGDTINANVNARLIENIFFKNSPLHDGAMIIADDRIASAACILPVSHNTRIPKSMGLRHRSALGITEVTDALAVVVSEETGNISLAHNGKITTKISGKDLERMLAQESID